jgi:hypothetical protein
MSQHRKKHIVTLVCALIFLLGTSFAFAAPSADFPPDPIDPHPRPRENDSPPADFHESTRITPAPGFSDPSEESPVIATRRLAQEATFISLGIWEGSVVDQGLNDNLVYVRIGKSIYDQPSIATEFTFDMTTQGYFGWSTGYKFLQDLGRNYEPYLKGAIAALYATNEGLGTFITWQRYQIRGEIGCDDLFEMGRSLRGELGLSWSGYGIGVYGGLGYAF